MGIRSSLSAVPAMAGQAEEQRLSDEAAAQDGRYARLRVAAWATYLVLAAVYLAALFSPLTGLGRLVVLEVIYTVPILVTIALGAVAARRSAGVERRFWTFLSIANVLLALCEVLLVWWVIYVSPNGPPAVSWPFQALHLAAATCFLGLVASMTRLQDDEHATRMRALLDVGALGVLAYVALLELYARPVMASTNPPVSAVLVGAAYPLAGFLLLFGTLSNIVGFKFVKWRSWEMLAAVAMALYALAVSLWPLWYTSVAGTTRNVDRGLLDLAQMTGHYILMMAAVYRLTERTEWNLRPLPAPMVSRHRWLPAVLPAASIAAIPLLGAAAFASTGDAAWFAVFGWLAVILTVIVICRSLVLALEHGSLFHRTVTDPLTGLYNHRFFHVSLAREVERASRHAEEFAVAVIDIDDFGGFNTTHGHLAGDRLLARLGEKLREACAGDQIVARLGGDEFGLLMPDSDARTSAVFAQHLIDVIGIEGGLEPGGLSASAGVAGYPEDATDAEEILRLADGALFHAKETGKGRVVVFEAGRVPDLNARERIERLERQSRVSAVRALAAAVDARDPATRDHSQKVASLAVRLGTELGMSEERVRLLELAALMHDVGKIGTPDAILNKTGPLNEEEWREVRQHSERGQHILASTDLVEVVPWVRGHHERWDGTGYPDGLAGEEIPREARILAVCDAYDAMTSQRAYQAPRSFPDALAEIRANSAVQFDPYVAETFVTMLIAQSAVLAGESADMPGETSVAVRAEGDAGGTEAALGGGPGSCAGLLAPEQA